MKSYYVCQQHMDEMHEIFGPVSENMVSIYNQTCTRCGAPANTMLNVRSLSREQIDWLENRGAGIEGYRWPEVPEQPWVRQGNHLPETSTGRKFMAKIGPMRGKIGEAVTFFPWGGVNLRFPEVEHPVTYAMSDVDEIA